MTGWMAVAGALCLAGAIGSEGGVVRGRVVYDGPIPKPVANPESGIPRAIVTVDGEGGLSEAVVWLDGVAETTERPQGPIPPAVMDQVDFAFVPHVLAVEAGREVEFRNSDLANHGVRAVSLEPANEFQVTTPPGGTYRHRFVASRFPVAIGCPLHPAMAAWVFVFKHPFHAVTDESGRFRIEGVPPGRYRLEVRHPSGGMRSAREVEVTADGGDPIRVEFHAEDLKAGQGGAKAPLTNK
ncbi:MAG: hypothetical protein KatS3mg108_3318 [Isosphaeraceae bacterium]|jgi:plastocyanin|nr:MAG: hypothetical protein KatS3mg108_3318 [Isosphaeraceae bacterium]